MSIKITNFAHGTTIDSAKLAWGDQYEIIQDPRLRECNPGGESYEDVKARWDYNLI